MAYSRKHKRQKQVLHDYRIIFLGYQPSAISHTLFQAWNSGTIEFWSSTSGHSIRN